jgi:coenzyme F420 biosynthesis associated uncharacterized protein
MKPVGEPVAWDVAERVGKRVAARSDTQVDWATIRTLVTDFEEVTAQAEALVEESTGLRSLAGPPRPLVVTRQEWVHYNISSFRSLLGPVLARVAKGASRLPGVAGSPSRIAAGAEMGAVLGWMSGRVLGQYDMLVADGDSSEDAVYYVGPNIVALERRYGFAPREFRLWIALHELTHRAQFTGVAWMREYFFDLVERSVAIASPDVRQVVSALGRMAVDIRAGRNPIAESGLIGALASPSQLETLGLVQGLMSLLEGHGEVTMDRAASQLIPHAAHFSQVLRARRESSGGPSKFFLQLVGLEAKLSQYAQGASFVRAVERQGGPELFALVWQDPKNLPSEAEIKAPDRWMSRLAGLQLAPG